MLPKFELRVRFNWGYWDGRADQERARMPMWAKNWSQPHPFDALYGQGYWIGRSDPGNATTSDEAWQSRPKLR